MGSQVERNAQMNVDSEDLQQAWRDARRPVLKAPTPQSVRKSRYDARALIP